VLASYIAYKKNVHKHHINIICSKYLNIGSKQKEGMYPELTAKLVIRLIVYFSASKINDVQPVPSVQSTPPHTIRLNQEWQGGTTDIESEYLCWPSSALQKQPLK
jgi:hypothetical protein